MKKNTAVIILLGSLLLTLIVSGTMLGAVRIKTVDVLKAIFIPSKSNGSTTYIVRSMRLPRTITAVLAGALLALSGLIFQCSFRNPMADSYVLGISSAGSLTVATAVLFSAKITSTTLPATAFLGAMTAALVLFTINHKNPFELLLSGIAMNFLFSALTTLLIYLKKRELETIMYWTMGNLANSTWQRCFVMLTVLILGLFILEKENKQMDILLLDDSTALSSGVRITNFRILLMVCASACVGTVVSFCGVIGFVGLMSPHFARLISGPKHRTLIPISSLIGSCILLVSDIISRTVLSPTELPVGIVTSILGAPIFFILLKRRKQ